MLLTTKDTDCDYDNEETLFAEVCGGGVWAPAGPLETTDGDGNAELIIPTGNGRVHIPHQSYAHALLRVGPGLEFEPGCDEELCADFNEWIPFAGIHRRLVRALGRPPAPRTFPSARPILALDRIYASPKTALIRKKAIRNRQTLIASDHLPVVAELDLNPITETNKRIRVE